MTADPGATPVAARALAPDLARGGMLLLIALANVHYYLYDRPIGHARLPGPGRRGGPTVVTVLQMCLVDGRAYPLFGLLFGYGIVQLAWRRGAVGLPVAAVTRLVRRRGRLDDRDRAAARRAALARATSSAPTGCSRC